MKITNREKIMLIVGVVIIVLALGLVLGKKIFKGMSTSTVSLEKVLEEKKSLLALKQEYDALAQPFNLGGNLDNMENRVIASLEKYSLRSKAGNLAPKVTSVDNGKFEKKTIQVRIKETIAKPVMEFIKDIEYTQEKPRIKIEKFFSRENRQTEGLYEFNIVLTGYAKKKG